MKKKNPEKTRINLLPAKDRNRIAKSRKRTVIFSIIVAYLIFIFLLDLASILNNNSKRTYISQLNQQLTVLKTKNILNETFEQAIDKRKNLLEAIEKKIAIIDSLKKLKVAWNKKISRMVAASPDGVWMSGLSLENGVIAINGNSLSLSGISTYINNLKNTGLFTKINLKEAHRKIIGGNTFYSFNLKAFLNITNINFKNIKNKK
ncbi:MAG: PilN domain-containing protein [Deltaproteobacteria bacterium]|nr:PilN domain-containing protein [Deltaproteobacteria bacterium]